MRILRLARFLVSKTGILMLLDSSGIPRLANTKVTLTQVWVVSLSTRVSQNWPFFFHRKQRKHYPFLGIPGISREIINKCSKYLIKDHRIRRGCVLYI